MKQFLKSFSYAARGFWFCIRHERNFRIHLVTACYILVFAAAFSLTYVEWAVLFLTLAMVLCAEAVNTALEYVVDLCCNKPHPLACAVKDIAAAAVLICAAASVAVGMALFGKADKLTALVAALSSSPWKLVWLAVSIPISILFILRGGLPKNRAYEKPPAGQR